MKKLFIVICICCIIWLFLSQVLTGILRFLLIPLTFSMISFLGFYFKLIVFDTLNKMKSNEGKTTRKFEKAEKENRKEEKTTKYEQDVKPLYENGKIMFNNLIKSGKMKRCDINNLKNIIDGCLGKNSEYYKTYKFKNDAHEIYVKMKNFNLSVYDWCNILNFLNDLESKAQ